MDAPHNVKLVVDVTFLADDAVLLTRYRDPETYDGQAGLFLPNDLLLDREDPEEAARRVLRDQLGVADADVTLASAESFTGMDRTWHLALHYLATAGQGFELNSAEHLSEPEWFRLSELSPRAGVAHGGWALQTLARIMRKT